jgi:predicted nucleic acid-binding protein
MRLIRKGLAAPDPNDEMLLEAAINGRADVLVTYK